MANGSSQQGKINLQHPTQYWLYLRRVLMSWFAEDQIEVDYVLLPVGWGGHSPNKSDHTFCPRPVNEKKQWKVEAVLEVER